MRGNKHQELLIVMCIKMQQTYDGDGDVDKHQLLNLLKVEVYF